MELLVSTFLAAFIMFGIPHLGALLVGSTWNQRRLARARAYRARHPFWGKPKHGRSWQ